MRYIKLLVASVILVSMTACLADKTELDMMGYVKTINIVGPEEIAFEQIDGSAQTKATSVSNSGALVFNWAVGDTLGIFPNKGNQVEFPITAQEGSTSASFDGGGWALRNNASYAAYYPFSVWNYFRNNQAVILDYSGQVQDGNGSFDHLSEYDYLASAKTTPKNSTVTFQMDRQGSILYIDIVVPEPATITSLTISCDEAIFVEKAALDISGNNPVVTPIETKASLTLTFENTTTTEQNETVRAYMAVQPVDFSSKTVTATLVTDAGTYAAPVVSRVVNKGKAAFLRFSDSFTDGSTETTTPPNNEIWYTSTDGNIVVPNNSNMFGATLLSNTYENGKGVMTFDGPVTMVGDKSYSSSADAPFEYCRNLLSISLPESVDTIGFAAFYNCSSLQIIELPSHIVYLGTSAFESSGIKSINIPETDEFGGNPITHCHDLAVITGPYASPDGRCLIKNNAIISFAPSGISSYVIPDGITELWHRAFSGCKQLESIIVPSTLVKINNQCFVGCSSLKSFVIPESVTNVGVSAFSGCSGLTSIHIPEATVLSSGVFDNCSSLCSFSGRYASEDGRLIIDNNRIIGFAPSGLTTYSLPDGVVAIDYGFDSLKELTEITIPASVNRILFLRGTSLSSVNCYAITPPSIAYAWSLDMPNLEAIFVPAESVNAYKTAEHWSVYADRIQATPDSTIPEAVDLGLPSGLKWASFNVGASAPEEYGDYFAWGDPEPYYTDGHSQDNPCSNWKANKTGYNWASYKWCSGSYNTETKYCTDSDYGSVDNKTVLDPEDDAANVSWGGSWRMPTEDEFNELLINCTSAWTTKNGINGRLFTSNINGNSIFLPAPGSRGYTDLSSLGSRGYYWTSSLNADDPKNARGVYFYSGYFFWFSGDRIGGRSIRPVSDEGVRVSVTNISLNRNSIILTEGGTASLTATVTPSNATQPNVIWSSSNTAVATVDYKGKVTAVAAGTATVTAKTYDGGYTATCSVTVMSHGGGNEGTSEEAWN